MEEYQMTVMYDRFENCFNDSKNSSKEELKEN